MILLERRDEVELVDAVLASSRQGRGGCVYLEGVAGLGKSRLVEEASGLAAGAGMEVLRARGGELESDFSFGVAIQLFEPLLTGGQGTKADLLVGAATLCEPLFADPGHAAQRVGAGSEFPLLHGLHWLAANAAERRPLLIVVDDAHWADVPSLHFMSYLLQRLDELPIALLVSARPNGPAPQARLVERIGRHALTTASELRPLSAEAAGTLVRSALGPGGDEETCASIVAAGGGNPFYLHDLVSAVQAGTEAPGEHVFGGGRMSGVIVERVERLPEPAARLAVALAVLGDGAGLSRAAALAGVDEQAAAAAADALADVAVLAPGTPLAFVHPLVRDAVYGEIATATRAQAHARAAALLREAGADAERVASHLVEAAGAAPDWSVAALRQAATLAHERGAPHAAVRYLGAAYPLVSEAERGTVLAELARAEARSRRSTAPDRALEAIGALADPREGAKAALEIGMALLDGSRPEAADVLDRGLERLGPDPAPDDELAMALRASRAVIGFDHATVDPGQLDAILERSARGVASPGERLMLAHGALAPAMRGESILEVKRLARASLDGHQVDPTNPTAASAFTLAATALFVAGEMEEATERLTEIMGVARTHGAVLAFGAASHVRAHSLHRQGRLDDAIADAQAALDTVRYGWEPELPAVHAVLALCLVERGELGAAEAALDIPGGPERWETAFTWADYLDARGQLHLARGDAASALEDFLSCGARLKPLGASHSGVVPWRVNAIGAALVLGQVALATELVDEDLELARGFGAPRELGMALRSAGILAGGQSGAELLREAVEVLRPSGADLELARALTSLGELLAVDGHRLAARGVLAEALDLAHRHRADVLEGRARGLLLSTGARPRRASTHGRDALTARERRIAQLAAGGLANREIAETLFITMKTVETHLGRAYRKLEIRGRSELPAVLADDPPES